MTTATLTAQISREARERIVAADGRPFLLSDWLNAVFIHFELPPEILQPHVPFELDLRDGCAYVSLVAFHIHRLRIAGIRGAEQISAPCSGHGFLNLRTYVRHHGEPGIYFLAEWLNNPISVLLGPRTFGLPYRWGKLDYHHDPHAGHLRGRVDPIHGPGSLTYESPLDPTAPYAPCEANSLDEFLFERYTAFTRHRDTARLFRVWHEPWPHTPLPDLTLHDTSLLATAGNPAAPPWLPAACFLGANYTRGVEGVWISRPRCVNGTGCETRWTEPLTPSPSGRRLG